MEPIPNLYQNDGMWQILNYFNMYNCFEPLKMGLKCMEILSGWYNNLDTPQIKTKGLLLVSETLQCELICHIEALVIEWNIFWTVLLK